MRALAAWILALGLIASPAMAGTGGAGDKESRPAANATSTLSAAAQPTNAPALTAKPAAKPAEANVETELQQLRDLLEAQARQLQEQQEKMAELEAALNATKVALAATPAPAASAAAPAPQAPPDLGKRIDGLENKLKSVGPFSFSGDFRLRDEPFFGGPSNQSQVRNRARIRMRFNATAKLNDDVSGGFSLASGDINDPISTNQTMNQFFTRKPFLLDRAFITYTPHQFKPLTLTGGRFAYPWYRTELTWDNDLNPEGLAQKLEWKSDNWPVLRQFALIGFELPFGEVSGVNFNLPNPNNRSIRQSVVYGGQIQTAWQLTSWLKVTADTAFYNYHNPDPIAFAIATANSSSPVSGLLKVGGSSFQNSYQTVTVTTPVCLPPACGTTTNVNTSVVNAKLNSKFALSDTILQFDIKTSSDAWPVRLLADYVQNTRACANASNPIFVPSVAAGSTATVATVNGGCNSRERRGYWLEARFGRTQKQKDWQFAYTRMFVEREAVMSAFNFSDLRQNSNVSQHRLEIYYQALNNVQFAFTGLFGRPLNFGSTSSPENILKRLQFDVVYKF
jgi:hypothetical protein